MATCSEQWAELCQGPLTHCHGSVALLCKVGSMETSRP